MKLSIRILFLLALISGVSALAFVQWDRISETASSEQLCKPSYFEWQVPNSDVPFHVSVDSRFIHTISLEDLRRAQMVNDLLPKQDLSNYSLENIEIASLDPAGFRVEGKKSPDNVLSEDQRHLLASMSYGSDFYISGGLISNTNESYFRDTLIYYVSVVPNQSARYQFGNESLVEFIQASISKETTEIRQDLLRPGKIRFVITHEGALDNVRLMSSSGYQDIDVKIQKLIHQLPGTWEVATDANGKTVDQELVLSFGLIGC